MAPGQHDILTGSSSSHPLSRSTVMAGGSCLPMQCSEAPLESSPPTSGGSSADFSPHLPPELLGLVLASDSALAVTMRLVCKHWQHSVNQALTSLHLHAYPTNSFLQQFPALQRLSCVQPGIDQITHGRIPPTAHLLQELGLTNPQLAHLSIAAPYSSLPASILNLQRLSHLTLWPLPSVTDLDTQAQRHALHTLASNTALRSLKLVNECEPDFEALAQLTQVTQLCLCREPQVLCVTAPPTHSTAQAPALTLPHTATDHPESSCISAARGGGSCDVATPGAIDNQTSTGQSWASRSCSESGSCSSRISSDGGSSLSCSRHTSSSGESDADTTVGHIIGSTPVPQYQHEAVALVADLAARVPPVAVKEDAPNVVELGVRGVNLQGVGALTHLVSLSVTHTTHFWRLPHAITQLSLLQDLDVSRNALIMLPDDLGALSKLTRLNISTCCLSELPDSFTQLTALRALTARSNPGLQLPQGTTTVTSLTHLDLSWCEGSNLAQLLTLSPASFTGLSHLSLKGHNATQLCWQFGQLTNLTNLDLSVNPLKKLPRELLSLKRLKTLDMCMCQLECLPGKAVAAWPSLRQLSLQMNALKELPGNLGQWTALEALDVSCNQLAQVPASVTRLHCLRQFKAGCNPGLPQKETLDVLRGMQPWLTVHL